MTTHPNQGPASVDRSLHQLRDATLEPEHSLARRGVVDEVAMREADPSCRARFRRRFSLCRSRGISNGRGGRGSVRPTSGPVRTSICRIRQHARSLSQGHAEKIGNLTGLAESIPLVKSNGPIERCSGIEGDASKAGLRHLFESSIEEGLSNSGAPSSRHHCHPAKMASLIGLTTPCESADGLSRVYDCY